ncbi:MAG: ribosomal protein S18-alanine N-acetyltransferase [Bacillota bacterium]|nr:ribosomal protein S18-alanine N-acetyltransferase [Bacillota bacterium]
MEDKFTLRRLTLADLAAISEIERLCFSHPWSEQTYRQELRDNPLSRFWGCFANGELCGFAGLWLVAGEGHVMNVGVHPSWRRAGIAELLMRRLLAEGAALGAAAFTLEVRASNQAAIALYHKLGFVDSGLRPGYYEQPQEDALIMWLDTRQAMREER